MNIVISVMIVSIYIIVISCFMASIEMSLNIFWPYFLVIILCCFQFLIKHSQLR